MGCGYVDWLTESICTLDEGHNPYLSYPKVPSQIGAPGGKWHADCSVDGCEIYYCESENPARTLAHDNI